MEIGEIIFYVIIVFVIFLILVVVTRWVYKVNKFLRYQKAMTFLLFKIAKKDMEENEIKTVISLINGELKVNDFKLPETNKR